jgi:choline dehydrogenase-like flavoprotein
VNRAVKKFWTQRSNLRMIPLRPGLQIAPPGRGFHSGGTFPMRSTPGGFQSDLLGRPAGLKRVHVVDASVFPSIPATTITLSVMANARRIAGRHGEL